MIHIIPNSIPKEDQDYIENEISTQQFEWYYADYSTYNTSQSVGIELKSSQLANLKGYYEYSQFRHIMYNGFGPGTTTLKEVWPRLQKGIPLDVGNLLNMRINMLLPLRDSPLNAVSLPHVDWNHTEDTYFTGLYYVNDSDGDTIIYNETYKDEIPEELTIKHSISPAKGTLVLFNTHHIHSGCLPSSGRRMVINFNFKVKSGI
jgi:hypothetical protein